MKKAKLEFYEKTKLINFKFVKQWRWRLKASNGKILCASSEGFFNKVDCISNAKKTGWALVELVKTV
tara:strand:- start:47539 stop:47739 length:201 start_codon:yes stop_codon:yes gene_type:complete